MILKPRSNRCGLYINSVTLRLNRSLTAAWPQPEPQPDRTSLYINNGDVTQTAAVRTAAVCLGHNRFLQCSERNVHAPPNLVESHRNQQNFSLLKLYASDLGPINYLMVDYFI